MFGLMSGLVTRFAERRKEGNMKGSFSGKKKERKGRQGEKSKKEKTLENFGRF